MNRVATLYGGSTTGSCRSRATQPSPGWIRVTSPYNGQQLQTLYKALLQLASQLSPLFAVQASK